MWPKEQMKAVIKELTKDSFSWLNDPLQMLQRMGHSCGNMMINHDKPMDSGYTGIQCMLLWRRKKICSCFWLWSESGLVWFNENMETKNKKQMVLAFVFLFVNGKFPFSASGSNLHESSTHCLLLCWWCDWRSFGRSRWVCLTYVRKSKKLRLSLRTCIEQVAKVPRKRARFGSSFDPDFFGNRLATVFVNVKMISS